MNPFSRCLLMAASLLLAASPAFAQFGSGFGNSFNSSSSMSRGQMMNIMAYMKTKAEGGNLKGWWKGEETFGITYTGAATYKTAIKFTPGEFSTEKPIDTEMNISLTPKIGFHINGNSNHLLARVSDNSIITFSVGAQADFLGWTYPEVSPSSGKTENTTLGYVQFGLPLTIDFKSGADVDFDRSQKTCFAVGGGMYPRFGFVYSGKTYDNATDFKMTPYLYASFGFFAGACWKIRASYMPGNFSIMESRQDLGSTTTTTKVTGPGIYTLGIGIMDWSWDWGKGNGWRGGGGGSGGMHRTRKYHARENTRMF